MTKDNYIIVSVQINKMFVVLCAEGSAFIVVCAAGYSEVGNVQSRVYIERAWMCCEHGSTATSLWLGLDLGDRHPSY